MRTDDVVIVGAGVIGLVSALFLAESGLAVRVLERGQIGQEASWAGGGILSPLHPWRYLPEVRRLAAAGMAAYPELARSLLEHTGIDPEWQASGLLILESTDHPFPTDPVGFGAGEGQTWHLWDGVTAAAQFPDFRLRHGQRALWCPEVAQVRNPRLLKALHRRCQQLGVRFFPGTEVRAFVRDDAGKLRTIVTDQGEISSTRAIVTAGAWSRQLLVDAGLEFPIKPMRGQMLLLQGEPGALPSLLLHGPHYLVQRRDGLLLVGSSTEDVGFDKSSTVAIREELLAFIHEFFPPARDYPVLRQWAGLRPGSPENRPFIGAVFDGSGLYIASGHFRYGLTMAPATASILREQILGEPTRTSAVMPS